MSNKIFKSKNTINTIKGYVKKVICMMLAIILAIPVVTFAAEDTNTYKLYADEAQYEGLNNTQAVSGTYDGGHGRVQLAPLRQSQIIFTVNVAEAGEYTLDIVYVSNNANKKLGYSINGASAIYASLTRTGYWSSSYGTYSPEEKIQLNAGNNVIKILSYLGQEGETAESPGIFAITVKDATDTPLTQYADTDAQFVGLNKSTVQGTTYNGHGYIELAASANLSTLQSKMIFTANVDVAGEYTLGIVYSSGNKSDRKLGYSVNDGRATYSGYLVNSITFQPGAAKTYEATVSLNEGENTITVLSPEDYKFGTIGAPEIWAIKFKINAEDEHVTQDDNGAQIVFRGGSLRIDSSDYNNTSFRFGYKIYLPEGATLNTWKWQYTTMNLNTPLERIGEKKVIEDDGSITTNLVITGIPSNYYDLELTAKIIIEYTLDGTVYTLSETATKTRTVNVVAERILASTETTAKEKEYANGILGR